ncbi:band 7 protein [candidate division TA06 bacterium DG_24]|jgi:flotillin|uniref:Band 7 protein n=2 Tax=Bacteria division TA06 TaxID=1156500 RepID=A0A0S8GA46_UNCT6|nr:MAG: band 7 protein [candidate division TA06 bacterium DG_24]KPK70019.1 MAG: band 7 protein [candidate division TA06 bacterium SM23_40]
MTLVGWLILAGAIVVALGLLVLAMWKQYRKVGPNQVLIISGGRRRTVIDRDGTKRKIGYRTHIGGGTFVLPFLESAQVLSLEVFTLGIETPEVLTQEGVPILAQGLAQVKVRGDEHSIRLAAEQFLGKGPEGIREIANQILEGHMRNVIGTMTVQQIYQNREDFARKVVEAGSQDYTAMGLQILSFALKDIADTQGYIEALGKPQVAAVKRDAAIAEAETERDATIKSALARKEGDVVKFQAETEVSEASRDYEAKRAEFQALINKKRAAADLAYDLERHRVGQELKLEEYKVKIVEKEQAAIVEEKEIERREKELEATVKKQADAERYRVQALADAESYRLESEAKGRTEAKKLEGAAAAEGIRAHGWAEADAMRKKAEAWREYNEAAVYQMFVEMLPQLARAVAEPLSKVEKIVLVGSGDGPGASQITGQVAKVLAQLPVVIESLTGIDIKAMLEKRTGQPGDQAAGIVPSDSAATGKEPEEEGPHPRTGRRKGN